MHTPGPQPPFEPLNANKRITLDRGKPLIVLEVLSPVQLHFLRRESSVGGGAAAGGREALWGFGEQRACTPAPWAVPTFCAPCPQVQSRSGAETGSHQSTETSPMSSPTPRCTTLRVEAPSAPASVYCASAKMREPGSQPAKCYRRRQLRDMETYRVSVAQEQAQ